MRLSGDISVFSHAVVVRCRGRIIFGDEVDEIARQVMNLNPTSRQVIVILSEVTDLCSGDLGTLWLAYMKARALGWHITFAALSWQLKALVSKHSIDSAFEIFPDEHSALQATMFEVCKATAA